MMKNFFYLFCFLSVKVVYSQTGVFVPQKLMVQDVVYLKDTLYGVHKDIQFPIVQSYENELDERDVIYYLIDLALNGPLKTVKPDMDADFPYSAVENRIPVDVPRYKEVILIQDNQQVAARQEINYPDNAIGISFIENWEIDISAGTFTKKVLGYEIITKEINYYENFRDVQYDIPFRVFYPEQIKVENLISCSKVLYEFPLAPIEFYFNMLHGNNDFNQVEERTHGYFDLPIKNYQGTNYRHAPLMGGFNKRNLIRELLNAVLEERIPAYDYYSEMKLSGEDIDRCCFQVDTIQVWDESHLQYKDTVIKKPHALEDYNSLIFKEQWFIDLTSGRLKKEVEEMALVKAFSIYNGNMDTTEFKKEIAFKIKLEN